MYEEKGLRKAPIMNATNESNENQVSKLWTIQLRTVSFPFTTYVGKL